MCLELLTEVVPPLETPSITLGVLRLSKALSAGQKENRNETGLDYSHGWTPHFDTV